MNLLRKRNAFDASKFVKKADYDEKMKKLKRKYLTITNTLLLIILINFLVMYFMKD